MSLNKSKIIPSLSNHLFQLGFFIKIVYAFLQPYSGFFTHISSEISGEIYVNFSAASIIQLRIEGWLWLLHYGHEKKLKHYSSICLDSQPRETSQYPSFWPIVEPETSVISSRIDKRSTTILDACYGCLRFVWYSLFWTAEWQIYKHHRGLQKSIRVLNSLASVFGRIWRLRGRISTPG